MRVLNTILIATFLLVATLVALPFAAAQFVWEWANLKVKK